MILRARKFDNGFHRDLILLRDYSNSIGLTATVTDDRPMAFLRDDIRSTNTRYDATAHEMSNLIFHGIPEKTQMSVIDLMNLDVDSYESVVLAAKMAKDRLDSLHERLKTDKRKSEQET